MLFIAAIRRWSNCVRAISCMQVFTDEAPRSYAIMVFIYGAVHLSQTQFPPCKDWQPSTRCIIVGTPFTHHIMFTWNNHMHHYETDNAQFYIPYIGSKARNKVVLNYWNFKVHSLAAVHPYWEYTVIRPYHTNSLFNRQNRVGRYAKK